MSIIENALVKKMEGFLKKEGFKADSKVLGSIASQVLEAWEEELEDVYCDEYDEFESEDELSKKDAENFVKPLHFDFFEKEDEDEDNDLWVYFKNRDMSFYLSNGECYGSGGWL